MFCSEFLFNPHIIYITQKSDAALRFFDCVLSLVQNKFLLHVGGKYKVTNYSNLPSKLILTALQQNRKISAVKFSFKVINNAVDLPATVAAIKYNTLSLPKYHFNSLCSVNPQEHIMALLQYYSNSNIIHLELMKNYFCHCNL